MTIEVDIDEWKKINSDWEEIKYNDKLKKVDHSDFRNLRRFLDNIQSVANNPAHTIDQNLNTL